ncbi:hypothetical protein O181_026273 [Austropuccinia psidii MF-1]|uniref:Uncharacterized protein n=1 Tax=Austropuccinia psidii MF-1 TaxID=1389203 RepID=A0A9Q3CM90_9BASI|nr:hypothetical protein [Austropuccinia psidii MF-1]
MESWELLEETPWSMDTDISCIEEEVWINTNDQRELNENFNWVMQITPEPCPDISTIVLPNIEFEEIFEKENLPLETVLSHPGKELLGFNLTKYEFLELLNWELIAGNIGNKYCNKIFEIEEHLRRSLFLGTLEFQDYFKIQTGKIKKSPEAILSLMPPGISTGRKQL